MIPLAQHRVLGEGDTTIFMFHGAYGDGRYFGNTGSIFAEAGYRVIIWDAPGYGGSVIHHGTSIGDYALAASDLVEATGSLQNVLLGHSMGGLIAPSAANLLGDRVSAVVLSASSPGLNTLSVAARQRFIDERVTPITQGKSIGEYAPDLLKQMMGPASDSELAQNVVQIVSEMDSRVFVSSMEAIVNFNGIPALQRLRIPALLLAGEVDTACTPAGMRMMADLIEGSEFQVLPGVGHYPFAEDPETYHGHILSFLKSHAL